MRIIEFDDGFDSKNQPTQGSLECTSYPPFANDAAFEAAKGSAGTEGDTYFNTTDLRIHYHDGTSWVVMSLPGAGIHAATHIQGAADEIDGDKASIDFTPVNYIPDFTSTPANSNTQLTAHLNGIDVALLTVGITAHAVDHISSGSDEIDGDKLDVDFSPTNYAQDTSPPEVTTIEELTAHLAGIDNELASVGLHAPTHLSGAADEIDGDKLDIDFTPVNYTPTTSPPEVTSLDELTSHLKGIDNEAGMGGVKYFNESSSIIDFATTSGTPVVITSMTDTIPAGEAGNYLAFFNTSGFVDSNNADVVFFFRKNTVAETSSQRDFLFNGNASSVRHLGIIHFFSGLTATDVIDVTVQTDAGTITVRERIMFLIRIS